MKKLLISVIIILVLVLTVSTIINGLEIGNIKILGITAIKEQNENLDNKIKEATKKASTDYPKTLDSLDDAEKDFKTTKEKYEEMVNVSTESEIQAASQYGVYEIGMLWIELGNHAKNEDVTMDVAARDLTAIDTTTSSEVDKKYNCNLYFTATGSYAGIAGFIEDIEDDSKLGFKIEDFKITASSEGNSILQATFTCKDIIIRGVSTSSSTSSATTADTSTTAENQNNTTNNQANTTVNNTTSNQNNTVNNTTSK